MRPVRIYALPRATDADGIATAQTLAGAEAVSLDGALVVGGVAVITRADSDSNGRPYSKIGQVVTVTSVGNDSGVVFTIVGKDQDGQSRTYALTGANAGVATATGYWSEVSSITSDGATAADITAGITTLFSTPTIPLDFYLQHGVALGVIIGTTATVTVNHTFDDINAQTWRDGYQWNATDAVWFDHDSSALVGATASVDGNYEFYPVATRLKCTAYTSGTVEYVVISPGAN